jgi:hypothetical protein
MIKLGKAVARMRKLKLDIKGFSLVEVTIGAGILALVMAQVGYQSMVSSRNAASTSLSGDFNAIFSAIDQTIKTPGGCDAMFSSVPFNVAATFPQLITKPMKVGAITITPGSTVKGLQIHSLQFSMIQPNINISGGYSQHTVDFKVTGQKVDNSGKPFPGASLIVRDFTVNVWEKTDTHKLATNACSGSEISIPVITSKPTLLQTTGTISPAGPSCVLPNTPLLLKWGELYATWGRITTTWGYSSSGSQNASGPIGLTAPATTGSYTATITDYSGSDANGGGPSATATTPAVIVSPAPSLTVPTPNIVISSPVPQTVSVNYTKTGANLVTVTYPYANAVPIPLPQLSGTAILPLPNSLTSPNTYAYTFTASNGCGVTNSAQVLVSWAPTGGSSSPPPTTHGVCGSANGSTGTYNGIGYYLPSPLCTTGTSNPVGGYVNGAWYGPPFLWTCTGTDNVAVSCNTVGVSNSVCGISGSGVYGYNGYTAASCTSNVYGAIPTYPNNSNPSGVWQTQVAILNSFCGVEGCAGYQGNLTVNYCNFCPKGSYSWSAPCPYCAVGNPITACNGTSGYNNSGLMFPSWADTSTVDCCLTNFTVNLCN